MVNVMSAPKWYTGNTHYALELGIGPDPGNWSMVPFFEYLGETPV